MSSVDFATWVYEPCFGIFARSITFYPLKSQPNVPAFVARGIFDTNEIDVIGMDSEIITDSRTELDILMPEWSVYPTQGDMVDIPWESDVDGGLFLVSDVHGHGNAGGELTLTLQRFDTRLMGYLVVAPNYNVGALAWSNPSIGTVDGYSVGSPSFSTPALG
jgi:hypothetical protein